MAGLIAATGMQHDPTVVTRNTDDLERCGARCINPWVRAWFRMAMYGKPRSSGNLRTGDHWSGVAAT
jgi:hypothetical protein